MPTPEELQAALDAANKTIQELNEKIKAAPPASPPPKAPEEDSTLADKAERERIEAEKRQQDAKAIERDITFNLGIKDFVKVNAALLPKEIEDVVRLAESENYDTPAAKASAVRDSIISTFFKIQANRDTLTDWQRETLDNYLKLTKAGRETESAKIFATVFEPSFAMVKNIKAQEERSRASHGYMTGSEADIAYQKKLIEHSSKRYGFKANG
jgi:hypothetical protein